MIGGISSIIKSLTGSGAARRAEATKGGGAAAGGFTAAVFFLAAAVLLAAASACPASVDRPIMRFPDIHGEMIAFVYGEDIWTVPASGGVARRLTIHDGSERFPKFSPDGTMIAFTGEYDANTDVYVMSVHGGGITRLTYHPGYDEVVGWHPDGDKILYSSARKSFSRFKKLFTVTVDGSAFDELIMHEAVQGSYSADGTRIAYNRVPREFRTWKRYKGGTAQDIYIFDFEKMEDRAITDFEGTDRIPMWIGDKIYFSSDRTGVLNIYSYDKSSEEIEQVTFHDEYDVRRPSEGGSSIVYELGGTLWVLDTVSGETSRVNVRILADAPEVRPALIDVKDRVESADCSPKGERALITARGEIFSVPGEHGRTMNLTESSGSRERGAVWSPDGSSIAYLSDESGEYNIYVKGADDGKARKLTNLQEGYRHTLLWSPDGSKIAFADQTLACYCVDVESGKVNFIDRAGYENVDVSLNKKPIHNYAWSPDGRFIAYSKMTADQIYQVFVYSIEENKTRCVSNGIFNDFGPEFSADGKHLFFVSNRHFDPVFCDFEWEMVYKDAAVVCALTLEEDGSPFLKFRSDEVKGAESENGKEEKSGEVTVGIDFEGIARRIETLPLPASNYRQLAAGESALFYLNKEDGDFNFFEFRSAGPRDLFRFEFKDREQKTVIKGIDSYRLSADGQKVVYMKRGEVGIIGSGETGSAGKAVDLSGLKMKLDPLAEWKQIFYEAWRMERDFYYEPGMHGLDWKAIKSRYEKLLPRMSCRQDVGYIIGEMIAELATSHTYVFGGDMRRDAERTRTGMLGVDWVIDREAGRYSFGKIYKVPDWTRDIIPPLARQGVQVREGDYIIEVNGEDVTTDRNIYSYFEDLAGKQADIKVSGRADGRDAREYTVKPLSGESTLRYLDWVEHNRQLADKESGGKIGYIHLPDTYMGSAREFPKYFYPQTRKKGLIVDGRFNGGGLNPSIFLRRLRREPVTYWTRRYSHDQTAPSVSATAHMVCLTNKQAGSGGDMLPMEFQITGMGPVIGTRTWGGLVGVSMWLEMVDGGGLSAPDYRVYDREGEWIVENVGVKPDIEIDLDPVEMSNGYDAQLMKAIEVLSERIENEPRPWPKHGPYPRQDSMKE